MEFTKRFILLALLGMLSWTVALAQDVLTIEDVVVLDAGTGAILDEQFSVKITFAVDSGLDEPVVKMVIVNLDEGRTLCQAWLNHGRQQPHGIVLNGNLGAGASAIDHDIVVVSSFADMLSGIAVYKKNGSETPDIHPYQYVITAQDYDRFFAFMSTAIQRGIIHTL